MWVEVWDTGIGIPPDQTGEIFEEFKQLGDQARTGGNGLGLTIVAKTAALLGLKIRVRSRLNRGSMFAIELPPGRALAAAPETEAPRQHRGVRIALVDDNPVVLHSLGLALRVAGNELIAASSGKDMLEKLGAHRPDILVSDHRLARGETGFDVIEAARAAFGDDLPAIILTGDTDPKLMRSMTGKGIAILHKPVEIDALLARMEEAIGRPASPQVI